MEDRITVNGIEYIRADSASIQAKQIDGLPYVIIRADRAGVFAGYLAKREGSEVTLRQVRRSLCGRITCPHRDRPVYPPFFGLSGNVAPGRHEQVPIDTVNNHARIEIL